MRRVYLTRQQARSWALDNPIGDPTGGPAYGEKADLATAIGVGAGANLLGGIMGADAASDAADAQLQGAREANATNRYIFDQQRADNAPFREAGVAANNRLAFLLGLTPVGGGTFGGGNALNAEQIRAELLPQFTSAAQTTGSDPSAYSNWNDVISRYGGEQGEMTDFGRAMLKRATTSNVDEAGLSAAIQKRLAEQTAAQQAAQAAASSDPAFGSLMRRFSLADLEADPVYQNGLQFGLNEGTKAINRQAAAGGGLLSGPTAKALARYATDYAGTKANESYNRFNADQGNQFNRLASLSGAGQTATAQVGAAGQNYANNVSANQIGVGNARAASAIGGANALAGGLTGAFNTYQQNQLMNRLLPGGGFQPNIYGVSQNPYGGFNAAANGGWGIE